jgi:surfeit locus 1 family protein
VSLIHSPGRVAVDNTVARPRSSAARRFLLACMLLVFLGFVALGSWQVKRLFWKLDLIERVNLRVHAVATMAPGQSAWSQVTTDSHEYLHVQVSGTYLYDKSVRVQASTVLGGGYWLLTPLRGTDGNFYFINRGFVSGAVSDSAAASDDGKPRTVTGLLRISEPVGGFLRRNDAGADRWFSRDIRAIASMRKLDASRVAPYFIDAEAAPQEQGQESQMIAAGQPVPGLTVVSFPNSHLVYAFTWYALALMMAGACFWVVRDDRRRRLQQAATLEQDHQDGKQGR